jgi:L-rhamnose mutarotase
MKHILLPTDFSQNALNAINYTIYLFEKEACTFYALNAYQVSPSGLSSKINKERDTRLYEITKEESERRLKELMEQLNAPNKSPMHIFESLSVSDSLRNALGRIVL